jgi:hypothetical protein
MGETWNVPGLSYNVEQSGASLEPGLIVKLHIQLQGFYLFILSWEMMLEKPTKITLGQSMLVRTQGGCSHVRLYPYSLLLNCKNNDRWILNI